MGIMDEAGGFAKHGQRLPSREAKVATLHYAVKRVFVPKFYTLCPMAVRKSRKNRAIEPTALIGTCSA